ncbi:beta-hexosaminidase subunit beta-like isoform X2 [Hyposmocoma kahamanoa]|uniref:beta-hexosaminidase subunit beta-like isoform X2 n=1 Tax=Hyposmocoma kahamanoa TaxID=1477025 RepID=UPI000E6D92C9|nr:beta-hexosaminidase subunit beta-like isoform X2 [Hyposmocoma kahamanoa]
MYKWTTYCLLFAFILILSAIVNSLLWVFLFDSVIPSKGKVWPKPKHIIPHDVIYQVRGRNPEIIAIGHNCILLDKVIARVTHDLDILNGFDIPKVDKSEKYKRIAKLNVLLTEPCEEYPYLGMDESYELTISTSSKLQATSIWGIIRGLETFVQLFYSENKNVFIRGETIVDYPNYEHRGLLLDTGRLFVPVYNLLMILDGMAMNKLNVFHWHICDNIYCPIKSEIFPNMSSNAQNLYTKDDVKFIVNYARERGIRVIPEFDVPGHQTALQKVFPSLFLHCNNEESAELMNPTLPETYNFLQRLLGELNTWFPDDHIHLGGDEAHPECWNNHNETLKYMKENNMSVVDLQTMFYQKLVEQLKPGMKQIVWQDVFDYGINMSTHDNIVQVWNYNPQSEMVKDIPKNLCHRGSVVEFHKRKQNKLRGLVKNL